MTNDREIVFKVMREMADIKYAYDSTIDGAIDFVCRKYGLVVENREEVKQQIKQALKNIESFGVSAFYDQ